MYSLGVHDLIKLVLQSAFCRHFVCLFVPCQRHLGPLLLPPTLSYWVHQLECSIVLRTPKTTVFVSSIPHNILSNHNLLYYYYINYVTTEAPCDICSVNRVFVASTSPLEWPLVQSKVRNNPCWWSSSTHTKRAKCVLIQIWTGRQRRYVTIAKNLWSVKLNTQTNHLPLRARRLVHNNTSRCVQIRIIRIAAWLQSWPCSCRGSVRQWLRMVTACTLEFSPYSLKRHAAPWFFLENISSI